MRVSLVVILLLVAAAPHASAQEPSPPQIDAFLEQRVAEELAADGILLSRLGVTLDVESVGDKLLVSLVDVATGRVSASTKVDEVPADRDAAVASVTQVVANLATQIAAPAEAARPAPPSNTPVDDSRAREAAEYEYRQQAIGFGKELQVWATQSTVIVSHRWTAHRGELRTPLGGLDFYDAVERPDLAQKYRRRQAIKRNSYIVAGVGLVATIGLVVAGSRADNDGRSTRPYEYGLAASLTFTSVAFGVGIYYAMNPHPISEGEAKQLAADHNRRLRESLGLPTRVSVSPYVSGDGGGLAVDGRF